MIPVTRDEERHDGQSIGELFGRLANQTSALVRQEVKLAQEEVVEKAADAGRHVGIAGAGGVLLHAGMLSVTGGVVLLLAKALSLWASALIVGVALGIVGFVMARRGATALKHTDLKPTEALSVVKEDGAWLKNQLT